MRKSIKKLFFTLMDFTFKENTIFFMESCLVHNKNEWYSQFIHKFSYLFSYKICADGLLMINCMDRQIVWGIETNVMLSAQWESVEHARYGNFQRPVKVVESCGDIILILTISFKNHNFIMKLSTS